MNMGDPDSLMPKPLILIADDEEANSILLQRILRKAGADIIIVSDGQQAVDVCRQNPDLTLVLMDISMPVLDGYAATKQIKQFRPGLPVIAITAFVFNEDEKKVLAAGCDDYMAKPFVKEVLVRKLVKYGIIIP